MLKNISSAGNDSECVFHSTINSMEKTSKEAQINVVIIMNKSLQCSFYALFSPIILFPNTPNYVQLCSRHILILLIIKIILQNKLHNIIGFTAAVSQYFEPNAST